MIFPSVVLALALLSSPFAVANPLPLEGKHRSEVNQVFRRQSADRICGDENPYSSSFQARTFQTASQTFSATGLTAEGTNNKKYPEEFRNDEGVDLPDCPGVPGPYQEFPIRQGGLLFADGADPGTDRIVYKITGTNPESNLPENFAYCGVITHIGASTRNGFVTCPDA